MISLKRSFHQVMDAGAGCAARSSSSLGAGTVFIATADSPVHLHSAHSGIRTLLLRATSALHPSHCFSQPRPPSPALLPPLLRFGRPQ